MPHTRNSGYPHIAEGVGRETHRDFAHFLAIARASLMETDNHLLDARDSKYLSPSKYDQLHILVRRALVATTRLQAYLLRTPDFKVRRPRTSRLNI
jgi:four helix bundle protein